MHIIASVQPAHVDRAPSAVAPALPACGRAGRCADVPADPSPQLGLEARLAARVRRSPEEFHAAAKATQQLWGQADWQPQSRCFTTLLWRSSRQRAAAMM